MDEQSLFDTRETSRRLDQFLDQLKELVMAQDPEAPWALVGIHRRGDILAERLRKRVEAAGGPELDLGVIDITLYRDDFTPGKPQPTVRPSEIHFPIDGSRILLIDDVFSTGRTIRAALTQLADFGRPRQVVLGVFIERNMRELPISPDHVGIVVERPSEESVQLKLAEIDGRDEVVVRTPGDGAA